MGRVLLFLFFLPCVATAQIITTIAGTGSTSFAGVGVAATVAGIPDPQGGTFDKHGNYYFGDGLSSYCVRKITPTGIITTVAGNGSSGFSGDGGAATAAEIGWPDAVAVDTSGNLFIADGQNNRIRKVDHVTGVITTIAGTGAGGFGGDGLPATAAKLYNSQDLCVDKRGNIYIADYWNNRVRKVDASGIITTIAGGGGSLMDGVPATSAQLISPCAVIVDDTGSIYFGEQSSSTLSNRVRKIDTFGIITTVAGNGSYTYSGDGLQATASAMSPVRIGLDSLDQLYIADDHNRRVYMVDHSGILHLVAGNGSTGFVGDGGPATAASINFPCGIAFDPCGNLFVPDVNNRRIRKVLFNATCNPALNASAVEEELQIAIFPNPTNNELKVENITRPSSYKLINVMGEEKAAGMIRKGSNSISVASLVAGLYMLQLVNDEGTRTIIRFVKQ